jgi:predicted RNA-binding Zn-ribbon protein involved in translation (DUF1610 family)
MSEALDLRCPFCGNVGYSKIQPENNSSFFISTANYQASPTSANPKYGMPVNIYGCNNCGTYILRSINT